jgi:hypothetical protein
MIRIGKNLVGKNLAREDIAAALPGGSVRYGTAG